MTREDGLKQVDETEWLRDDCDCLNLFVTDPKNRAVHCWLQLRPDYCDRGFLKLKIDMPGDSWRFFSSI